MNIRPISIQDAGEYKDSWWGMAQPAPIRPENNQTEHGSDEKTPLSGQEEAGVTEVTPEPKNTGKSNELRSNGSRHVQAQSD